MKLYVNIDSLNVPEWQNFCIGRLSQEYGKVVVVSVSRLINSSSGWLKKIQVKIEDKFSPVYHEYFDNIIDSLEISVNAPQKGDIILDLTGTISATEVELGVRIWNPIYNGQHLSHISSIGEYELIRKSATFNIDLCENGFLLDSASYNPHYSAVKNWKIAAYSLHWLVLKCLRNNVQPAKSITSEKRPIPNIRYSYYFYKSIAQKLLSAYANKFWGYYRERWTIGLAKGSFLSDGIGLMKILPEPQNEFWADPFLYYHKESGKTVLFIERFPFKEKKGVISCAEVDFNLGINGMHDILVRDYHFSYPHIIEEHGALYMMPESSANQQLEVYKCVSFPNQWKLYTTAFHGLRVADTVYYKDTNGDSWLFTTYSDSSIDLHCTMLMIYKVDSINLKTIIPHKKNPILINSTCARNGGRIYEEKGKVYRVSQDNSHRMYGHGINIHEITRLTIDDYEEILVSHTEENDLPQGIGTHQMCQIDNMFVMDIRKH